MDTVYIIRFSGEAVFLLNGSFVERPDRVRYRSDEPLYVTVLPLNALLLPYTVKLLGGRAVENGVLCDCYKVGDACLCLLRRRHNYVYAPQKQQFDTGGSFEAFFAAVKHGDYGGARSRMTEELSATLSDDALDGFFADYEVAIENTVTPEGGYLLLGKQTCSRASVTLTGGLISDISCE